MNKLVAFWVLFSLFTGSTVNNKNYAEKTMLADHMDQNTYDITAKQDILSIMASYPGYITDLKTDSSGFIFLITKSGRKIIYDDKKNKSYEQKLAYPDLQDMLEQIYPLSRVEGLQNINYDPGRIRVYELLEEVYGRSRNEVEKNLIGTDIGQGSCSFNKNNTASAALNRSMSELRRLSLTKKNVSGSLYPISGTYNYRIISGTNRLSPHSFGIAIDLARNNKDYWKWASRDQGQKRLEEYPYEIVKEFEKNNFIWGGKWGHFDILHFEYRPEIILKARLINNMNTNVWYYGASYNDQYIRDCINRIDRLF